VFRHIVASGASTPRSDNDQDRESDPCTADRGLAPAWCRLRWPVHPRSEASTAWWTSFREAGAGAGVGLGAGRGVRTATTDGFVWTGAPDEPGREPTGANGPTMPVDESVGTVAVGGSTTGEAGTPDEPAYVSTQPVSLPIAVQTRSGDDMRKPPG